MTAIQEFEKAYSQNQAVIFRLRDKEFGIEIAKVREVAKRVDVTVVHFPEGIIRGVVNLRGQIVMAVDLAKRLGLPELEDVSEAAWMVFVEWNGKTLGLIVDQVLDVVDVSVTNPPVGIGEAVKFTTQVKKMGCKKMESIALLEVENVFSDF